MHRRAVWTALVRRTGTTPPEFVQPGIARLDIRELSRTAQRNRCPAGERRVIVIGSKPRRCSGTHPPRTDRPASHSSANHAPSRRRFIKDRWPLSLRPTIPVRSPFRQAPFATCPAGPAGSRAPSRLPVRCPAPPEIRDWQGNSQRPAGSAARTLPSQHRMPRLRRGEKERGNAFSSSYGARSTIPGDRSLNPRIRPFGSASSPASSGCRPMRRRRRRATALQAGPLR